MQKHSAAVLEPEPSPGEFFRENGYLILGDLGIDTREIITAVEARIADAGRLTDGWRRMPAVRALACDPTICATLAELFDADMAPFQTLNFPRGTEQPVHTDAMFFDTAPGGLMAGVWIALEDIHEDAGPLEFYPGSHVLPTITPEEKPGRRFRYDDTLSPALRRQLKAEGFRPHRARLKKGEALIWHANLAHGGSPIRDRSRTRWSQVTHYFARGHSYVQPISSWGERVARIQPTDIRTGRRHGEAPIKARAREAVKNALRWAPVG